MALNIGRLNTLTLDLQTGLWCDTCLLPSKYTTVVAWGLGESPWNAVSTWTTCDRCAR